MDWFSKLDKRLKLDKANSNVTSSSLLIKRRREEGVNSSKKTPTNIAKHFGKKTLVPHLIKRRREEGVYPSKATAGGERRYIKALSVLTILTVILSIVIVGVAIMTTKKFDVDSITENDIPLAIGAGIGQTSVMAALFSTISPMDLLEEIDLDRDKKQKEDEKKKSKNNNKKNMKSNKPSTSGRKKPQNKKKKTKPRRKKPRRKVMRPKKMPARSLRRSSRGLRFIRGLFRFLLRR